MRIYTIIVTCLLWFSGLVVLNISLELCNVKGSRAYEQALTFADSVGGGYPNCESVYWGCERSCTVIANGKPILFRCDLNGCQLIK